MAVRGVVVDSGGKAVQAADVRFRATDRNASVLGAPAVTDKDGHFVLSVVAGRSYHLVAELRTAIPGAPRLLFAESAPFDAVGEIQPLRLVVAAVR